MVVIPALNEAATIAAVVGGCLAEPGVERVIVVDDGSADQTAATARGAGASLLQNDPTLGKGVSLSRGMTAALAAGATHVATLDGDGQHRPEDLPRLLAASRAWPDRVVIGSRRACGASAPSARRRANRVADFWISWAAGQPIEDTQSGFRIYPAALLRALAGHPSAAAGFAFESEILIRAARAGFTTVAVDVPAIYDAPRPSHFRPVADITRIVIMVGAILLRRGMDPCGLWRSLTLPRSRSAQPRATPPQDPQIGAPAEEPGPAVRQSRH
ncbi:MAG: glycosyltransferase family 2 protein [Acetobacteraceae bacterium]|nr:glycosyltransferase family 2 protein [Acetobacteraceae bacterium]